MAGVAVITGFMRERRSAKIGFEEQCPQSFLHCTCGPAKKKTAGSPKTTDRP